LFNGVEPQRDANPDRRLKIGYVSSDFRDNPLGRLITPLLENHDRAQFEVHCFADVLAPDAHTRRLQSHADHWHITATYSDEEVADFVRNHHIDVLVDLRLHASPNRLLLFARKPAPVQITYLNYPSTSGLRTMDWRITDSQLDPKDAPQTYTERALMVSGGYWCYEPHAQTPEVAPLPAQRNGFVTFGWFNSFSKVSPAAFSIWRELLTRVGNSRLLLHALPGSHRDRLQNDLAQHQIQPQRLEFVGKLALGEYLKSYGRIDIGLDGFPFPGTTTTCDALYMGVPVITLAPLEGSAVGRMGASILASAGLGSFVARTTDDYLRIAQTCAAEPTKLAALRAQLRTRIASSKLMDKTSYIHSIETGYRHAWRAWCASRR
jgi:predicted O-linked N-acetylglucosamine transferase (SPINDLY family)